MLRKLQLARLIGGTARFYRHVFPGAFPFAGLLVCSFCNYWFSYPIDVSGRPSYHLHIWQALALLSEIFFGLFLRRSSNDSMPTHRQWCPFRVFHILILLVMVLAGTMALAADRAGVAGAAGPNLREIANTPEQLTVEEEAEVDKLVLPLPRSWTGDFDGMRQRHLIRILVPYSKTFYSVNYRGEERGLDYDYGKALERWLRKNYPSEVKNKHLLVVFVPTRRDQLLKSLVEGRGDIVAGGLTVTEARQQHIDFTAPLVSGIREALVTSPDFPVVETLEDLSGKEITVRESSSYYEHLVAINRRLQEKGLAPIVLVKADEWLESEDLLEMVNAGLLKATVVDRYLAAIWQPLYTEMRINDTVYINEGGDLAWAIRKNSPLLKEMLADFMKAHRVGTTFGNMMVKRYVKDSSRVLNATSEAELQKFRKLVDFFKLHAAHYGFDYLMLVAQGYQESMLDQKARSHAGAVGIMQLLPATAADPAINIRGIDKDAGKNIEAGAKYLRLLTDKYLNEAKLDPVNTTLMAFAAYNAGPGNLRKFRRLAEKSGYNPNIWFKNVEYAAARIVGEETVKYVANIYKYYVAYNLVVELKGSRNRQDVQNQ